MTARDPLQLVVHTADATTAHPLVPGTTLRVGRAEEADIRVVDAAISRAHAIFHAGPPLEVEDLGSANGTHVSKGVDRTMAGRTANVRTLSSGRIALAVGDVVTFGGALAVVRRAPRVASTDAVCLDPHMTRIYEQAARAAAGLLSVLVLGETGVGKELLARHVHQSSKRANKSFLAINCGAIAESLLEGELFGYERGAFTGAVQARAGLIESADGGTLFLDEVGELPPAIQVKLLRVLEQREVVRLGARSPRKFDVRFVAATNKDLEQACAAGTFREDLYFRLNGISLTIPPLRERQSELDALAARFLASAAAELDRPYVPTLSPAVIAAFAAYPWPGNVRELRNVIDRAVVLADDVIQLDHIPTKVSAAGAAQAMPRNAQKRALVDDSILQLRSEVSEAERRAVLEALEWAGGNQTKAAELLGISRRTLLHRLDEYGIERPRKR